MDHHQPNNPLHGKTLEMILNHLVAHFGWEEMGRRIRIHCFMEHPSVASSLKFLRKTTWARKKVERLFLENNQGAPVSSPPPVKARSRKGPHRKGVTGGRYPQA